MIKTALVACAVLVAGCAPAQETPQQNMTSSSVPAPTPDDVSVRINAAQDGQVVSVAVNQRFAIELVGVPTAGYVWEPAQVPEFITRAGEVSGNTTEAQAQPGFTGGNHWEVTMFAATAAGTGEIVMEQRRPWETGEQPLRTFRVTIVAQ
jgi:predicted secreted protein